MIESAWPIVALLPMATRPPRNLGHTESVMSLAVACARTNAPFECTVALSADYRRLRPAAEAAGCTIVENGRRARITFVPYKT
jgi:hypothetical protein